MLNAHPRLAMIRLMAIMGRIGDAARLVALINDQLRAITGNVGSNAGKLPQTVECIVLRTLSLLLPPIVVVIDSLQPRKFP